MKQRSILFITTLVALGTLIYGFTNWHDGNANKSESSENIVLAVKNNAIPDLYYGVDTRFAAVKKADVHNATTIYDFLNEGEKNQIEQINSVKLVIVKDNQLSNIQAYGYDEKLTKDQLEILRSTDYFSHFTIRTEFQGKSEDTGKMENRFFGPHITVTPEKQATYLYGKDALLDYLKDNSIDDMQIIKDGKLGAIKLSFTITKEGNVSDVKHDAMTTGYPSIDERFMTLLKNIPGKWIPAENSEGEKMDQELVFTFGPRDGC